MALFAPLQMALFAPLRVALFTPLRVALFAPLYIAIPFEDGESIKIKVNCRLDGGVDKNIEIPYGIAVSLEVAEGVNISIYDEIKARIATAVQIQQQT